MELDIVHDKFACQVPVVCCPNPDGAGAPKKLIVWWSGGRLSKIYQFKMSKIRVREKSPLLY